MAPVPLFHPLWGDISRYLLLFGELIPRMYFFPPSSTAVTLAFLSTGIPCQVLSHCSSRFETLQLYGFLSIYFSLNLLSFFPGIPKMLESSRSQRSLQSWSSFSPVPGVSQELDGSWIPQPGLGADFPNFQCGSCSRLSIKILPYPVHLSILHFQSDLSLCLNKSIKRSLLGVFGLLA